MNFLSDAEMQVLCNASVPEEVRKIIASGLLEAKKESAQQSTSLFSVIKNPTVAVAVIGVLTVFANFGVSYMLNRQSAEKDKEIESLKATIASQQTQQQSDAEAQKSEREFSYRLIERELNRATGSTERAQVLYFLSSIEMLKGLNNEKLQQFAEQELINQGKDVKKIGVPSSIGLIRPDYAVPLLEGSSRGIQIANIAITELNRNFLENEAPDVIRKYWKAVDEKFAGETQPNTPWSAAFVSWAIKESGLWPDFTPSASNVGIWKQAYEKKRSFFAGDKTLEIGDIVFVVRNNVQCDIKKIREGNIDYCPASSGIVFSVDGNSFQAIMGNQGNAVRISTMDSTNKDRLIGFARL